jgi:hypothetical protein
MNDARVSVVGGGGDVGESSSSLQAPTPTRRVASASARTVKAVVVQVVPRCAITSLRRMTVVEDPTVLHSFQARQCVFGSGPLDKYGNHKREVGT